MASVALITGATGLVGRQVLQQWTVEGLRPVAVGRDEVDLLVAGAAADLVNRLRPAVVVHLAWSASGTEGYRSHQDNEKWVAVTLELAETCNQVGAWLLATGTPLDDDGAPVDAYSSSKSRLRSALRTAIDADECTWLRPYYVVDPGLRRPALVGDALAARDQGQPVALMTPERQHDFVHAADVGSAIDRVVSNGLRGEVPIGSGRLRRVKDLVTALGATWAPVEPATATSPHHEAPADIQRLSDLGWSPACTKEMFHGE